MCSYYTNKQLDKSYGSVSMVYSWCMYIIYVQFLYIVQSSVKGIFRDSRTLYVNHSPPPPRPRPAPHRLVIDLAIVCMCVCVCVCVTVLMHNPNGTIPDSLKC